MSKMVERVAKAMAEQHRGCDLWSEIAELSDIDYLGKDHFREQARAAIQAMREPTEAMKIDYHYEEIWKEMIDEALK